MNTDLLLKLFLTALFYLVLYSISRYLFGKINAPGSKQNEESASYFRHDLLTAIALYLICILLFFYPCLPRLNSSLIGPPEDNMQHFANMQYGYKALVEHDGSLAYSGKLFYPEGTYLYYNDYSFYNLFLFSALRALFPPILLYNLLILSGFLLAGIGAFLLIRYLTRNSFASLVGGSIFAFNPSHFAHAQHHITQSSIQFFPFFVLFFIKTLRGNSLRDLFYASLFFFLNTLTAWSNFFISSIFLFLSYVYLMLQRHAILLFDVIKKISVIAGLTFLAISPWVVNLILVTLKYNIERAHWHHELVGDALAFFVPGPYHLFSKVPIVTSLNRLFTGNDWEKTVYLGIISLSLILFTFNRIITKTAKYFLGIIAFIVFTMGVYVHALGKTLPIVLPYYITRQIFFLSHARAPSRNVVFVYLFLSIVVAFGIKYLAESHKRSSANKCLIALICFLLFFDYYSICGSMTKAEVPACYKAIKKEREAFGIVDLPQYSYLGMNSYMMYQIYHGFPIVQGAITRRVGSSLADRLELIDLSKQKKQLEENKVKYVVVHKRFISEQDAVDIDNYEKHYKAIYRDKDNIVFRVY